MSSEPIDKIHKDLCKHFNCSDSEDRQFPECNLNILQCPASRIVEIIEPQLEAKGWVSVVYSKLDEIPMDRGLLLCDDCKNVFSGYLCLMTHQFKYDNDAPVEKDITHWQPLPPEPPEGNNEQ